MITRTEHPFVANAQGIIVCLMRRFTTTQGAEGEEERT